MAERVVGRARSRAQRVRDRQVEKRRRPELLLQRRKVRRRRRLRRRYDVPLPVELGAEIQLPALPRLRTGPRLISAVLLSLNLWVLQGSLASAEFIVSKPQVEGMRMLSEAQVRSIAEVDDRLVFLVDPREVATRLEGYPEIADAEVRVGWPNEVEITVQEREPLVEWEDAGRTWWLSSDGIAFVARGERSDLVRVRSEKPVLAIQEDPFVPAMAPQVLLAAAVLHKQLPAVGELTYDPDRGFGVQDARGWQAYFGLDGDMVMKAYLYLTIAADLERRGVSAQVVSVEDPAAPYFRLSR